MSTEKPPGQRLRFVLVGIVNTGTYYVAYLLLHLALPYLAAHVLAFVVSTAGSLLPNILLRYRTRSTWWRLPLYPLTTLVNFVVITFGVVVAVQFFGVGERGAPALAGTRRFR